MHACIDTININATAYMHLKCIRCVTIINWIKTRDGCCDDYDDDDDIDEGKLIECVM
jgi:hypothetical protein